MRDEWAAVADDVVTGAGMRFVGLCGDARVQLSGSVVADRFVVCGGKHSGNVVSTCVAFDSRGLVWISAPSLRSARASHTTLSVSL